MKNEPFPTTLSTPLRYMFAYATGNGVLSIIMNGIANFAMLYYTKILGLDAKYAGTALGVSFLWDGIVNIFMGHITDNTRSRYGRRHPYILIGGILVAISFFFLWFVPDGFHGPKILFWYLLGINLFIHTAGTVFLVPYYALGFEICTDYNERSKLQGISNFFNMLINFLAGACAWPLFFRDGKTLDGLRLDGAKIANNYTHMGIALSLLALFLVIFCVWSTRRYARDSRNMIIMGNNLRSFFIDFWKVISDKFALFVFLFFGISQIGTMLVAQIQMFTYVDFMKFTHNEKFMVHGGGMFFFCIGSLIQAWMVKRWDKKPVAIIAFAISIFGSLMLYVVFIGGLLKPEVSATLPANIPWIGGKAVSVSALVFLLFQGLWWGGFGILCPLTSSMIADVSEINYLHTGLLKDGSYSAILSFMIKLAQAFGLFLNGMVLSWSGYISGAETQIPEAIRKIAIMTFVCGPIICIPAILVAFFYPINRHFMARVKEQLALKKEAANQHP